MVRVGPSLVYLFLACSLLTLISVSFLGHEDSLLMIHDAWRAHESVPFLDYAMPWGGVSSIIGANTLSFFGGELKGLWFTTYSLVFNLCSTYLVYILLLKHGFGGNIAYFSSLFFVGSYIIFFGGFYVDYLCLTFGLGAIYLLDTRRKLGFFIASCLLALGFYVKQTTGAIVILSLLAYVFVRHQFRLKHSVLLLLATGLLIFAIFIGFYLSDSYAAFKHNFYELPFRYAGVEKNKSISSLLLSLVYPLNLNLVSNNTISLGMVIFIPAVLAIYGGYFVVAKELIGNTKNYTKASFLVFMLIATVLTSASTGRDLPHRLFFSFAMIPIIAEYIQTRCLKIIVLFVPVTLLATYFCYRVYNVNPDFKGFVSFPIVYNKTIQEKLSYVDFKTAVQFIQQYGETKEIYLMDDRMLMVSAAVANPVIGNKLYFDINLTVPRLTESQREFYLNEFELVKKMRPYVVILPTDTCNRFMRSNECLNQTLYAEFKAKIRSLYSVIHYGDRIIIFSLGK